MGKPLCVAIAPVLSVSGYGKHAADLVRCLIRLDMFDVKVLAIQWGGTPLNALTPHTSDDEILARVIQTPQHLGRQPDLGFIVTIPSEYPTYRMAKYNIGVTAGIETTICPPNWLEGCNVVDLNIVPSRHSDAVFKRSEFTKNDQQGRPISHVKLVKPMEVLFEGADTNIYKRTENILPAIENELANINEEFNFLFVGHWIQGSLGNDRKDVGMLIKVFLETFKNQDNAPGLILKTNQATFSILDRNEILKRINDIKNTVQNARKLPNVYLLHGQLSDEEMNSLYNHPKIKAMVSFTKGEGFCVKDYTKILTSEGLKRIDTIKKEDFVLSHDGKTHRVTNTMKRHYDGTMYNIIPYCAYPGENIFLTPNHHILIYNKEKNDFLWKSAEDVLIEDYICYPIKNDFFGIEEINISDYMIDSPAKINQFKQLDTNFKLSDGEISYTHSDKTARIHNIKNTIKLDSFFGKIIGYYLSEGTISRGDIIFSLNLKEKDTIAKDIINSMQTVFGLNNYSIKKSYQEKNSITLHFSSKIVAHFLKGLCGEGAKNKYIPPIFFLATKEFKENLITSLLLGDGYICESGIEIDLVNNNILRNIRHLLFEMGIISTYQINKKEKINKRKNLNHKFNGNIERLRILNESSVNKTTSMINNNHSFCNYVCKKNKRKNYIGGKSPFIHDNMIIFPIKKIKTKKFKGNVYNISVEDSESYTTENYVVHNCRPMLECTMTGKLVIASGWGGQIDFLDKDLSILLPGKIAPVDQSAVNDWIIKEGQWFTADYNIASNILDEVFKNYSKYISRARKQMYENRNKFSLQDMQNQMGYILKKYVPEFPEEVQLKLPIKKISLPKPKSKLIESNDLVESSSKGE